MRSSFGEVTLSIIAFCSLYLLGECTLEMQLKCLEKKRLECEIRMATENVNNTDEEGLMCPVVWDMALCWPRTPAGTRGELPCPECVDRFDTRAKAYRYCTHNGTWWQRWRNGSLSYYTNYLSCPTRRSKIWLIKVTQKLTNVNFEKHLPIVRIIDIVGYSVSLPSLALAVFLMTYFRRLRCQRNVVHINMFASFMVKCVVILLKYSLMTKGAGFDKDLTLDDNDQLVIQQNVTMPECKTLMVAVVYTMSANYMWIFGEGVYLHLLMFSTNFSETKKLRWFVVTAWALPLLWVIPWVIVRIHFEDIGCWVTHHNEGIYWIIKTPITIMIVANFIFFINIIRILFMKLSASCTTDRSTKYRKLARSMLVLFPLFGVHYIIFIAVPEQDENNEVEVARMYIDNTFGSLGGFLAALLFCFLTTEVQTEIRKYWQRRWGYNGAITMTSHASSKLRVFYRGLGSKSPQQNKFVITSRPSDPKVVSYSDEVKDAQAKDVLMSRSISSSVSKDGRANDESVHSDHNDNALDSPSAYEDGRAETDVEAEVYQMVVK